MFITLLAGATFIGFSGIFVRLADVGPAAAGFWRMVFALPVLVAWTALEQRKPAGDKARGGAFGAVALAGLTFGINKRRKAEGGFPGADRIQRELAEGRLVPAHPETLHSSDKAYYLMIPERKAESAALRAFRDWLLQAAGEYRGASPRSIEQA